MKKVEVRTILTGAACFIALLLMLVFVAFLLGSWPFNYSKMATARKAVFNAIGLKGKGAVGTAAKKMQPPKSKKSKAVFSSAPRCRVYDEEAVEVTSPSKLNEAKSKKTGKVATEENMPAGSDVRRYSYSVRTNDADGKPILKKVTITHQSWNNLASKEVRKGFIWLPGQVMPPDWMQEVGGKMNGIDPKTGQICEMEIPAGMAINYSDRGNAIGIVGKYSKVPNDRHLLKQIDEERKP